MKCICHKCKGEIVTEHTDAEYFRWMIKHRVLDDEKHGGDWRDDDIFPSEWGSEVLKAVLDIAMRGPVKYGKKSK